MNKNLVVKKLKNINLSEKIGKNALKQSKKDFIQKFEQNLREKNIRNLKV
jgi:hypothetical protein